MNALIDLQALQELYALSPDKWRDSIPLDETMPQQLALRLLKYMARNFVLGKDIVPEVYMDDAWLRATYMLVAHGKLLVLVYKTN